MVVALDANILIYAFEGNDQYGRDAMSILKTIEGSHVDGVTSELVYAEVCSYSGMSNQDIIKAEHLIEKLGLDVKPITKEILLKAAEIRRICRIKLPDAIYVATALMAGAEVLITNNQRLAKQQVPGLQMRLLKVAAAEIES